MSEELITLEIKKCIHEAFKKALAEINNNLDESYINNFLKEINVEVPRDKSLGDYATNIALKYAKNLKTNPLNFANLIIKHINSPMFSKVEVKPPGFINFFIVDDYIYKVAYEILKANENYGRINLGNGIKVNVEFGSVNPTGPISVSHGRQVVLGDVFSSLLQFANYNVFREYYCNDAGNQIYNLGKSVLVRYRNLLGADIPFPEDGYHGTYVIDIAKELILKYDKKYLKPSPEIDEEAISIFGDYAKEKLLNEIISVCEKLGVKYDKVYSELSLYKDGIVDQTLKLLKEKNLTYEKDGALWFLSTKFDDEKDRVLIKSDGKSTYALSDIAYHKIKYERGFELLITFLGADHHGYVKRLHALVSALGYDPKTLIILIHQFVTMLKDGEVVRMSKRAANYVELNELIDEVGVDAVRYFFIMRKMDAHLDFDINLAKSQSMDNPVYYVQYCHARCHGILNEAQNRGYNTSIEYISSLPIETLKLLNSNYEIDILKRALEFPKIIKECVENYAPHLLCHYVEDFAKLFQSFYTKGKNDENFRIVTNNSDLTYARLFLVYVVLIVVRNILNILGINTPKRM